MSSNVLITGVTGFVGRNIAGRLCREHKVYGIGRHPRPEKIDCDEYDQVDLSDEEAVTNYAEGHSFDHIVHCAASLSFNDTKSLFDTNITGVCNVLHIAAMTGCRSIVYISSLPLIGVPSVLPITETHPVNPTTSYHLSKFIGELLLQNSHDVRTVSLRIPSPIGPGMPGNKILPVFIKNCMCGSPIELLGQGGRTQNYIDVRDIAQAVELAVSSNCKGVYNVASDRSVSNLELAQICKKVLNSSAEIRFSGSDPEEKLKWEISIDKARMDLGFSPVHRLEDTIKEIASAICES